MMPRALGREADGPGGAARHSGEASVGMLKSASRQPVCDPDAGGDGRKMVVAELMGGHTHTTLAGVQVHVWRRGGAYLARGRYHGRAFGETLGGEVHAATARLRRLLTEMDNGSFVRPSEARNRQISNEGRAA